MAESWNDAETLLIKKGGDRRKSSPLLYLIKDGVHHCGAGFEDGSASLLR